uniref:Uncharacterized protein LOC102803708 n=1 Tax=Saccoglossus kowalevskii TaxID=10224 RepID=A0ABM0MU23_SACKO|nr:PREDICTED: uncharacterized protein LOC102803708 [Saccoglossus kowalevskii]
MTEVADKQIQLRSLDRLARRRRRLRDVVFNKKTMDPQMLEEKRRQRIQETLNRMNNNETIVKNPMMAHSRYLMPTVGDHVRSNGTHVLLPTLTPYRQTTDCMLSNDKETDTDAKRLSSKILNKFRLAALCMIISYRLVKKYALRKSDRDMLDFFSALKNTNLLQFDHKVRVSPATEHVLGLHPSARKPELLRRVQAELHNTKSVAEYPVAMQQQISKYGSYVTYGSERVVIRYGQRPHAFYFLLSGSAILVEGDPEQVGRAVRIMKEGESFGDFIDIFMAGGMKNFTDSSNNTFLKSGAVAVSDSNKSEWIYIIKSGSCSVLKMLKRPDNSITQARKKLLSKYPSLPTSRKRRKLKSAIRKFNHQDVLNKKSVAAIHRTGRQLTRRTSTASMSSFMPQVAHNEVAESNIEEEAENEDEGLLPPLKGNRLNPEAHRKIGSYGARKMSTVTFAQGPFLTHSLPLGTPAINTAIDARRRRMAIKVKPRPPRADSVLSTASQQSSMSSNSVFSKNLYANSIGASQNHKNNVFIKLDILERGSVFGLLDVAFGDQPSLSLVSNGAECILISKKFYLKYASEANIKSIVKEMRPYPSEETLTADLEQKINWTSFRKDRYHSAIGRRKPLRRTQIKL